MESNNLRRIWTLKQVFAGVKSGFMDHSQGTSEDSLYLGLAALGAGVLCIAKHVTLDPLLELDDYISALPPSRLAEFVRVLRKLDAAMGTADLMLTEVEEAYRTKAAKVAVAMEDLVAGTVIAAGHLALKRVGRRTQ